MAYRAFHDDEGFPDANRQNLLAMNWRPETRIVLLAQLLIVNRVSRYCQAMAVDPPEAPIPDDALR